MCENKDPPSELLALLQNEDRDPLDNIILYLKFLSFYTEDKNSVSKCFLQIESLKSSQVLWLLILLVENSVQDRIFKEIISFIIEKKTPISYEDGMKDYSEELKTVFNNFEKVFYLKLS